MKEIQNVHARAKLLEWFAHVEVDIVYLYEDDNVIILTVLNGNYLQFHRLFLVGTYWHLSVDRSIFVGNADPNLFRRPEDRY